MAALRLFSFLLFASLFTIDCALAEKRVALVIGNSAYKNVWPLANPSNDAALVGDMFKKADFDSVDVRGNLDFNDMRQALRDFGAKAREADVAVVYYAGHGIEVDGINYLIPTDARLEVDTDVLDETYSLDRVLAAIEPARQLRLVILDACRDNPFAKTMKRTVATRSIGRGLAKVEQTAPNTMIAFAAKAGSTALDGNGNSPFAAALVARLPTPGLDLRRAFGYVRDDVIKSTGSKQEPFVYGSLGGDDVPLVPAKPSAAASPGDQQAARDFELALQIGTREVWSTFLVQYPSGLYATFAKDQLRRIAAEEDRAAAAAAAKQAEGEKVPPTTEVPKAADQEKAGAIGSPGEKPVAAATESGGNEKQERQQSSGKPEGAGGSSNEGKSRNDEGATLALTTVGPDSNLGDAKTASGDLVKRLQSELIRVGCYVGSADGNWSAKTRAALESFNQKAGTSYILSEATSQAIEGVHAKEGRVCHPLNADNRPRPPHRVVPSNPPRPKARCFVAGRQSFCE